MLFGMHTSNIKFSRADGRRLRRQQITETEPGPIVHDFDALLDYVRERRLRVTQRQHQLPLSALAEINARLQNPLVMGLQRPQQKSYPPIHGLYLLLRASGLTYLDETGAQPYLQVDDSMASAWESLNPTERYGSLLEIWFLRGRREIVGENPRPFQRLPENFERCLSFLGRLTGDPVTREGALDYLYYTPGWHNLGLLALFGLIKVERGAPVEGEGWQIASIQPTPFGKALLARLYTSCFSDLDWLQEMNVLETVPPGLLQTVLEQYFPAWEHALPLPREVSFREGLHVFKVTLWKGLWRRLAIPAELTFADLASAILNAFAFDHSHLYMFEYESRLGTRQRIYHPYMDEGPWASETRLGEVPLRIGQPMIFLYDFGDHWEFEVTFEEIALPKPKVIYPQVVEARGEAPEQYPRWE